MPTKYFAALAFTALAFAAPASAAVIDGSLSISSRVTDPGSALTSVTSFALTSVRANGGTGTFAQTTDSPAGVIADPTTITIAGGVFNGASNTGLSFTLGGYGSFASSSVLELTQTANFVDFYVTGIFTATPSLGSFTPDSSPASVRLSFNRSATTGGSTSAAITLSAPPALLERPPTPTSVPEPASIALIGAGLVGLGLMRRRKA